MMETSLHQTVVAATGDAPGISTSYMFGICHLVYISLMGSDIHRSLPSGKHRLEANDELCNDSVLRKHAGCLMILPPCAPTCSNCASRDAQLERIYSVARVHNVASLVPHGFCRLDTLRAEPVGYFERQRAHFGNIIASVMPRNNPSYSGWNWVIAL